MPRRYFFILFVLVHKALHMLTISVWTEKNIKFAIVMSARSLHLTIVSERYWNISKQLQPTKTKGISPHWNILKPSWWDEKWSRVRTEHENGQDTQWNCSIDSNPWKEGVKYLMKEKRVDPVNRHSPTESWENATEISIKLIRRSLERDSVEYRNFSLLNRRQLLLLICEVKYDERANKMLGRIAMLHMKFLCVFSFACPFHPN